MDESNRTTRNESDHVQPQEESWILRLYVAGGTKTSTVALVNLKTICEEYLAGTYAIEVFDLLKNPQLAEDDRILAAPTLVRRSPSPRKKIVGDLSNKEKVLIALDLVVSGCNPSTANALSPVRPGPRNQGT